MSRQIGFLTRKHGTARQRGTVFPVLKKGQLPARLALPKPRSSGGVRASQAAKPTFGNNESGISNITYLPPSDKEGYIEFNWGGHKLSGSIVLVDKEDNIGQWSPTGKPVVYLDKKLGVGFIKYCAIHELLERFFQNKLNLPWDTVGHNLAEEIERREYSKSHDDWDLYSKQVRQISRMNMGGKTGRKIDLKKAFAKLSEKQRELKWHERGLDSILMKQTAEEERKMFSAQLKKALKRHLKEV